MVNWNLLRLALGAIFIAIHCEPLAADEGGYVQLATFPEFSNFRKLIPNIGHIYGVKPNGSEFPQCTGLIIAERNILTARHCLFDGDEQINIKALYIVMGEIDSYSGKRFNLNIKPVDKGVGEEDDFLVLQSAADFGEFAKVIPKLGNDPAPRGTELRAQNACNI